MRWSWWLTEMPFLLPEQIRCAAWSHLCNGMCEDSKMVPYGRP